MKLFTCQHCSQLLYFENRTCERCSHRLGYIPEDSILSALEPANPDEGADIWQPLAFPKRRLRFCDNAALDACNWLVPHDSPSRFCKACRYNRTIPDLDQAENLAEWRNLEIAKHRLFYSLVLLKLPLANRADDPEEGLAFDFLAEAPGAKVLTGHEHGLITLNLKEADDAAREKLRTEMGEPYRTLLGHFRHEIGHYFWDRLVRDGGWLNRCREIFGDDSQDYNEALKTHYANGAPPDWQDHFVSAYASCHPWEDFAETWAHYLHIIDTLEMARAFGLRVRPKLDKAHELDAKLDFDPYNAPDIDRLVDAWLPLSFAVNSLNRSMGQRDLYPFILSAAVVKKLGFIHDLVHADWSAVDLKKARPAKVTAPVAA